MKEKIWVWYLLATAGWLGAVVKLKPNNLGEWLGFSALLLLFILIISFAGFYTHSWVPKFLSLLVLVFLLVGLFANLRTNEAVPISKSRNFSGVAVLVSDPRPIGKGIIFRAELIDATLEKTIIAEIIAFGEPRYILSQRLLGEWVNLSGILSPPNSKNNYFSVQAKLQVKKVGTHGTGQLHTQLANAIRRNLERGASSLDSDQKSLFTGVVYGDDRNQSLAQRDLFRSTGLTHILAVSGQNVVFILLIFYPLLKSKRLPLALKWLLFSLVLGIFLTITRFEPSVMRATVMTTTAFFMSSFISKKKWLPEKSKRPEKMLEVLFAGIQPRATLAIAVLVLTLIDPSLVFRLAFQLSVAASAGIIFISAPLSTRLFGPKWFRMALAITVSAQISVAPLLVTNFGAISLSSLPANILVLPAVGVVTIWGMTGGLLAGVISGKLAEIIHLPIKFFLGWIEAAARFSENLSLGWISHSHIVIFSICLFLFLFLPKLSSKLIFSKYLGLLLCLVIISSVFPFFSPKKSDIQQLSTEVIFWEKSGLLVVEEKISSIEILKILRQNLKQTSDIELLVFQYVPLPATVEALNQRYKIKNIWVPTGKYIAKTLAPEKNSKYFLKDLILEVKDITNKNLILQVCMKNPKENIQSNQLSCYTLN